MNADKHLKEGQGTHRASLVGLRVLVVEDSWHIASAIKSVVEAVGMTVLGPAATVTEATRHLTVVVPDLAIVDINLQGELTYDFIDGLISRTIPVIIVSGYEVLPSIAERADAVLKKPIRASALLAVLRQIAEARIKN